MQPFQSVLLKIACTLCICKRPYHRSPRPLQRNRKKSNRNSSARSRSTVPCNLPRCHWMGLHVAFCRADPRSPAPGVVSSRAPVDGGLARSIGLLWAGQWLHHWSPPQTIPRIKSVGEVFSQFRSTRVISVLCFLLKEALRGYYFNTSLKYQSIVHYTCSNIAPLLNW